MTDRLARTFGEQRAVAEDQTRMNGPGVVMFREVAR
jgi:hypothetical protein